MVARRADLQNLTVSQRIVDVVRTAGTGRIARDREAIAIGEKRAVRQRIAAHQSVRKMDIDMAAGIDAPRQLAAQRLEQERDDIRRFVENGREECGKQRPKYGRWSCRERSCT